EFVRIWKGGAGTKSLSRDLSKLPGGKFSPVFRDHPDGEGSIRALPGGIVVVFDPAWDFQKISEWASSEKIEVLDKLPIGKNAYVVRSEPGLAALELANRLQESGKIQSASPDWWREVEPN
ncbi:MAG: hypothetical protein AB1405_17745, partial [Bdellovibrionota bacterium]